MPTKTHGRPRLVNQVLVNRMVALREQGFSHREIAQKVDRSERTVRRYTKGVSPQLQLPAHPKPVDVLVACSTVILTLRRKLELDTAEVDIVLRALRKAVDEKDPLSLEWLSTDRQARVAFLVDEVLRKVMPGIKVLRRFRQIREELGAGGGEMMDDDREDSVAPPTRSLPP